MTNYPLYEIWVHDANGLTVDLGFVYEKDAYSWAEAVEIRNQYINNYKMALIKDKETGNVLG